MYGLETKFIQTKTTTVVLPGDGYELLPICRDVIMRQDDEVKFQNKIGENWDWRSVSNLARYYAGFTTQQFYNHFTNNEVIGIRRKKKVIPEIGDIFYFNNSEDNCFQRICAVSYALNPAFSALCLKSFQVCSFSEEQTKNANILFKKEKYLRLINEG